MGNFEFTFIKNSTDQRFWILCVEIIHLTTGALQHWTGVIYFTFDNDTSVDTVKESVKKEIVGRGKFLGYRLLTQKLRNEHYKSKFQNIWS